MYYQSNGKELRQKAINLHIPMKLTTLNRCKLTSQSGGESRKEKVT